MKNSGKNQEKIERKFSMSTTTIIHRTATVVCYELQTVSVVLKSNNRESPFSR